MEHHYYYLPSFNFYFLATVVFNNILLQICIYMHNQQINYGFIIYYLSVLIENINIEKQGYQLPL